MTTPPEPSEPATPAPDAVKPVADQAPADAGSSKGDLIAVGIGCAVFLIMLVAIILVGISGR